MSSIILFLVNSIALGVGLAMDAFSVSIANGLSEPDMKKSRACLIAGTYALFQFAMPMIGWVCVRTVAYYFKVFSRAIPWIALILLAYIGGKMIIEAIRTRRQRFKCASCDNQDCDNCDSHEILEHKKLDITTLIIQGIATSIDALSVGFTISEYTTIEAASSCLIIALVTFIICMFGLKAGRKLGERLEWKASMVGGIILIAIGVEIFISGIM